MRALVKERGDILALESAMQDLEGYDPEGKETCLITHYFAPGVYAREMWMPKDCLITGKIHLTEHLNILSQGRVSVSNKGESVMMTAPHTFVSPVGTKRAIYAHEDSTWTTIHATDLTDPDEIETEIIAETFEELDGLLARDDYERFLLELDLTEEDIQLVTHRAGDVLPLTSVKVKKSSINGFGIFPVKLLQARHSIPAMIDGARTIAGRFTNHSGSPNVRADVVDGNNINLVTTKEIGVDEEITTDYRDNLKVQGLKRIS